MVTTAPLHKFLADQQRAKSQQIDDATQVGKVLVVTTAAADEFTFTVTFNETFIEQPIFHFGPALDTGQLATPGQLPSLNALVISWISESSGYFGIVSGKPFASYTGAVVGVTTVDPTGGGTNIWCHYSFSGRAQPFSNTPATSNQDPSA